jgi:uncharacterized protein YbcI
MKWGSRAVSIEAGLRMQTSIGHEGDRPIAGELNAAIARAVGRIHRDRVGRGPTKAQAFFRGNVVVVVLENVLVKAERTLLGRGLDESVVHLRNELFEMMRPDLIAAVETLTDRHVTALMSASHMDPDIAGQIFVLDQPIQTQPL